MTFLAPWLLVGLAATVVPVLLHLFWKSRAKTHIFPALIFLRSAVVRTARRRRVQDWLLMLLRCGLIAVLVFAVAEPVSRAAGFLGGRGNDAVIILDDSFSMSANSGDMTAFENARAGVLELIGRTDGPSRVALFFTASSVPSELSGMTGKISDVRQAVSSACVSYAHASPATMLAKADEFASHGPTEIFIFSDFQKNSFNFDKLFHGSGFENIKNSPVYLIKSRKGSPANIAVTSLRIQGPRVRNAVVNVAAQVVNYSRSDESVSVELILPDSQPLRKPLDLPAGSTQTVLLPMELSEKGPASGQVRIKTDDPIICDDARFFAFTPRAAVRAIVISDDDAQDGPSAAGRVLSLALDWRTDAEKSTLPWPVSVKRIKSGDFTVETLKSADAVFVCGVGGMSPSMAKKLSDFARGGGVVMFFVGPAFDAGVYGATLDSEMLPGAFASVAGSAGPDAPAWKVAKIEVSDPLLAGLYQSADDFPQMNVQRFVPIKPAGRAKVLLTLENSMPLLLRQSVGDGHVFWCATSASPKWSNLPATGVFLPFVLRVALWRAMSGDVATSYTSGDFVPLVGEDLRFLPQIRYTSMPGGVRTWPHTAPGLFEYSSVGINGLFALNCDSMESDCECYDVIEMQKKINDAGFKNVYVGDNIDETLAKASHLRHGYNWRSLLACIAILMLLAELAVSNRVNAAKNWN